jgi:hypothetical protein
MQVRLPGCHHDSPYSTASPSLYGNLHHTCRSCAEWHLLSLHFLEIFVNPPDVGIEYNFRTFGVSCEPDGSLGC